MFRVLFLTFWGDFRGWKIDPRARAPRAASGHHDAAQGDPPPAPEPHESPWTMTLPLLVLAAFALVGGIFNAGLFWKSPGMDRWLEPIFELTDRYVKVNSAGPSARTLAVPGVLVFFVGALGAYYVYAMKNGAPARAIAEKSPRLYQLVLDKWRIDELYENTVLSAVDTFAETSALFDKWIIDGIIARLTSLAVAGAGALLRAFQTGVVHVYAAMMVIGVGALGWFFVWQPQARATVREEAPGKFLVEASPGLGYRFRWHSRSPDQPDADAFTAGRSVQVELVEGETKLVKVDVMNAFNRTATSTVAVTRPAAPADSAKAAFMGPGARMVAP